MITRRRVFLKQDQVSSLITQLVYALLSFCFAVSFGKYALGKAQAACRVRYYI